MKNGTTTRIIDRCIQELFNNGFTFLYDVRNNKPNTKTKRAFYRFELRMNNEHFVKYKFETGVFSDIWCYKITLI